MCPVIERVAQAFGHGLSPALELLAVIGIAGAVTLVDPVAAHRTPLVVVALEPDLGEVAETPILGDHVGRQMAVVVDDRLRRGVLVIELAGQIGLEQEIRVDEGHGGYASHDLGRATVSPRLHISPIRCAHPLSVKSAGYYSHIGGCSAPPG